MRKVSAERGVVCRTKRHLFIDKSLAVKSLHPAAAYSLRVIFIFYTPPVCSKNTGGLFMSKYKFKLDARTMALMSLLIACEIVLSRFCSVNTHGVKLGFSFIPAALCGIILGPGLRLRLSQWALLTDFFSMSFTNIRENRYS